MNGDERPLPNPGRVFIVQRPVTRSRQGGLSPKFEFGSAALFGQIETLLSSSAQPFNPGRVIPELWEKLGDFCDDDYLLCAGSPILIGWSTAVAAVANEGRVKMLQWNGKEERYIPVHAVLWDDEAPEEGEELPVDPPPA